MMTTRRVLGLGHKSLLLLIWSSLIYVASCKMRSEDEASREAMRQTPTLNTDMQLTGMTGRHLTLRVRGIRPQESKGTEHRVCALALHGLESTKTNTEVLATQGRMTCHSEMDPDGVVVLNLYHLPYPAYITVFHDENSNSILDFASFDIVVAKKTGPSEGVGTIIEDDHQSWPFSRPVWVEVGHETREALMHYGDLPFKAFVKEQIWSLLFGLYEQQAKKLNNPGNPRSPTNTIGPPPVRDGRELADP